MITGTVWGLTLIAVGLVATFAATQVLLSAVLPARFARMRGVLRVRPVAATTAGVSTLAVAILVAIGVGKALPAGGAILAIAALFLALFGMGAVASEIGERLPSTGVAAPAWRALVRGSIVCSLASLLPFAGWIVLFPLLLAAGFGAWVLSFVGGDRPKAAPPRLQVRTEADELVEAGA
jgi:hypothetical protein